MSKEKKMPAVCLLVYVMLSWLHRLFNDKWKDDCEWQTEKDVEVVMAYFKSNLPAFLQIDGGKSQSG